MWFKPLPVIGSLSDKIKCACTFREPYVKYKGPLKSCQSICQFVHPFMDRFSVYSQNWVLTCWTHGVRILWIPSVRLSICQVFLPGTAQKFSDFLLEVRVSFNLKVTEPDFFLRKILFWSFWPTGPKLCPKWGFSSFTKNWSLDFL